MSRLDHGGAIPPSLEEIVVVAFAAQRLARALSTDSITAPLRHWVERVARTRNGRATGRLAGSASELLACPVCTGWWASLAVSAAWPGSGRFRRGLSAAGVQVLLALLERLVSERGRSAIHDADIGERRTRVLDGERVAG
jgi:hypothetical protein